jgi:hypothetical protein
MSLGQLQTWLRQKALDESRRTFDEALAREALGEALKKRCPSGRCG